MGSLRKKIGRKFAVPIGNIKFLHSYKWLKNPVFIIGAARSGTTLLERLLESNCNMANYSEVNELWDPDGYPWHRNDLNRTPFWFDPELYYQEWKRRYGEGYLNKIKSIFGSFQMLMNKEFFLNKSPFNTFRIAEILQSFPNPRFIHIYRDGRAVSFSNAGKIIKKIENHRTEYNEKSFIFSFEELVRISAVSWDKHIIEVDSQILKLGLRDRGLILELSYEKLCHDSEVEINKIFDFLGVKIKNKIDLNSFILSNRNYKYKNSLSKELISEITEIMEDSLRGKKYY